MKNNNNNNNTAKVQRVIKCVHKRHVVPPPSLQEELTSLLCVQDRIYRNKALLLKKTQLKTKEINLALKASYSILPEMVLRTT